MNSLLRSRLERNQRLFLVMGILSLGLCSAALFKDRKQFFTSYFFGYLFWLGLTLGCFSITLIHHLTGGRWGYPTRRFLEAGFGVLPVMTLLFIPILFGLPYLFPWAQVDLVAKDETLEKQHAYLNTWGFVARAFLVFSLWNVMAWCLRRWSLEQDRTPEPGPTRKLRTLSGPGIVLFVLSATFAYVDWILSTESHWYSTMFPVIVLIGQILTGYCFAVIVLALFRKQEPLYSVISRTHYHHLGNLLLTFVLFWTYVCFGQLLIIYAGNLPREIKWYLHRIAGSWVWIPIWLGLFHFFLPFFLLLFRTVKTHVATLTTIAVVLFVSHALNVYWLLAPSFHPNGIAIHWSDFAAFFGMGGIWIGNFLAALKSAPLLPQQDPGEQFAFAYGHAH